MPKFPFLLFCLFIVCGLACRPEESIPTPPDPCFGSTFCSNVTPTCEQNLGLDTVSTFDFCVLPDTYITTFEFFEQINRTDSVILSRSYNYTNIYNAPPTKGSHSIKWKSPYYRYGNPVYWQYTCTTLDGLAKTSDTIRVFEPDYRDSIAGTHIFRKYLLVFGTSDTTYMGDFDITLSPKDSTYFDHIWTGGTFRHYGIRVVDPLEFGGSPHDFYNTSTFIDEYHPTSPRYQAMYWETTLGSPFRLADFKRKLVGNQLVDDWWFKSPANENLYPSGSSYLYVKKID
jgi:hypothetical protein